MFYVSLWWSQTRATGNTDKYKGTREGPHLATDQVSYNLRKCCCTTVYFERVKIPDLRLLDRSVRQKEHFLCFHLFKMASIIFAIVAN